MSFSSGADYPSCEVPDSILQFHGHQAYVDLIQRLLTKASHCSNDECDAPQHLADLSSREGYTNAILERLDISFFCVECLVNLGHMAKLDFDPNRLGYIERLNK